MVGCSMMKQNRRYEYAGEELAVLRKSLISEAKFGFEGHVSKVVRGWRQPKSLRTLVPIAMNARRSTSGIRFAAPYAESADRVARRSQPGLVATVPRRLCDS